MRQGLSLIHILVNTAAIVGKYNKTIDYGFDNFKKIYSINVFGTFLLMSNILPIMVEQKSGSIVNFGSVSGMTGYTFEIGYGSSKWAVIGMTKNAVSYTTLDVYKRKVYLMPMVPNMYMEVMQKDSRKAYFNISLWKFLKCL